MMHGQQNVKFCFWSSNHFSLAHRLLEAVFFHNILKAPKNFKV